MRKIKRSSLEKRQRAEKRFKWYGRMALLFVVGLLMLFLGSLLIRGYSAFWKTEVLLTQPLSSAPLYEQFEQTLNKKSIQFPPHKKNNVFFEKIMSPLSVFMVSYPSKTGLNTSLKAADEVDAYLKGRYKHHKDAKLLDKLYQKGVLTLSINKDFLTNGDSLEPSHAGLWSAAVGSFYTLFVTLCIAFPLGVGTAVYLEEFAPQNGLTRLIEVNINNLAAVPSIIFGLLGLAVFLNLFGLPRSSPLVGGMTLALMTLPPIILATQAALRAIPKALRDGARAMGASDVQVVLHHTLPLATPGIVTGTLLGLARAMGESAPLIMIGMAAFVAMPPFTPLDPATTLPVQIYSWIRNPEIGFIENAAAAILILIFILGCMSLTAILIRKRYKHRW